MPVTDPKRYWVVRTDREHRRDVIVPSLERGELRQGWSGPSEQDLNVIGPIVYESGRRALSALQQETWTRVQRFWPEHWAPISAGDLIVVPNIPHDGHWRLVEAVGGYRYSPHPETMDHGHILHVRLLVADIANTNVAVSAALQRTMRNHRAMWNVDHHGKDIDRLVGLQEQLSGDALPEDRLRAMFENVLADVRNRLGEMFLGNQLEVPVHHLISRLVPDATVVKTAGSREHGADFVIDEVSTFGECRRTVVQLKDHDPLSDQHALAQVQEAFSWYAPVHVAVIVTTAQQQTPAFEDAKNKIGEKLGIPVTVVLGDQLCRWLLLHLEEMVATAAA